MYIMNNDTGTPPTRKRHLLMTTGTEAGKAAGCGKKLSMSKCRRVEGPQEMRKLIGTIADCAFCFRSHTLPRSWNEPGDAGEATPGNDDTSTMSSGSDSDLESDTDSDKEALPLKRMRRDVEDS